MTLKDFYDADFFSGQDDKILWVSSRFDMFFWVKIWHISSPFDTFHQDFYIKEAGDLNVTDHVIDFMMFFREEGETYRLLFITSKKLILANDAIDNQRSVSMHNFIACRISQKMMIFRSSKSISSYIFWGNHPQTSKRIQICSRHQSKDLRRSEFWFKPLNRNYVIFHRHLWESQLKIVSVTELHIWRRFILQ